MLPARSRAEAAAWTALVVGLGGIVVAWLAQTVVGGDTGPLLAGTEVLGRCLADLDLVSCEQPTPIGPFPILQYVPDLVAHAGAGLSEAGRLRVLSTLSGLGVAAAVGAAWVVLRRVGHPQLRWVFLLAAISGPVLAYGSSTWGEMLAAALLTLLVAAALLPAHPALVGLAAFGAGLTKETGYPFVIGLALVSLLWARGRTGTSIRRHVLFGAAGVALALAVGSAFNVLRFGTPRNAYYLDPALRTASPEKALELAAGLFVSPNGGIVFFWPLASALVALLLTVAAVRVVRGVTSWREGWLPFALVALVLALTAGLATWWAPFGWWAWGPRLSLPWVFPLLLLVLAAFGATPHCGREQGARSTTGLRRRGHPARPRRAAAHRLPLGSGRAAPPLLPPRDGGLPRWRAASDARLLRLPLGADVDEVSDLARRASMASGRPEASAPLAARRAAAVFGCLATPFGASSARGSGRREARLARDALV